MPLSCRGDMITSSTRSLSFWSPIISIPSWYPCWAIISLLIIASIRRSWSSGCICSNITCWPNLSWSISRTYNYIFCITRTIECRRNQHLTGSSTRGYCLWYSWWQSSWWYLGWNIRTSIGITSLYFHIIWSSGSKSGNANRVCRWRAQICSIFIYFIKCGTRNCPPR